MTASLIRSRQAENFVQAIGHADHARLSLNRHVTVAWGLLDLAGKAQSWQGELFALFRHWCAYRGFDCAYVWTIENGQALGLHSHILLHCPDRHQTDLQHRFRRWVIRIAGRDHLPGRTIRWSRATAYYRAPADTYRDLKGITRYMLKGLDPRAKLAGELAADLLKIHLQPQRAGLVPGKRIGVSQSISAKARMTWSTSQAIISPAPVLAAEPSHWIQAAINGSFGLSAPKADALPATR